ncbi:Spy/CpxP family protein refolding chaperone [Zoogloea sp.]|uniref:Spy/CpxP family protein refolding chaperone n=1 Tax=Zoogloea sp. TaxID=49181 RepID=UPI0035AFF86A
MKLPRNLFSVLLLSIGFVGLPFTAQAAGAGDHCHGPARQGFWSGPEFGMHGDGTPPLPFLRDLNLSEGQRDQIFKIFHEQAPVLREKAKEIRKSHEELRALTFSAQYDEARIKALAEQGARAVAEMAEIRAAGLNKVYQTLTPEQRKKADERKAEFEARGFRHPQLPPTGERRGPAARG